MPYSAPNGVATPSSLLYCSLAMYEMAEFGMMRTMVAELPRHKRRNPSCWYVILRNLTAPLMR